MATTTQPYHHGDLRNALVRAAVELLEEDGAAELSLRAAARRAGVSTAAPYRHFSDRDALLSAVAAVGYQDLAGRLTAAHPAPTTADDLAAIAIAYVQFALARPGLFRVMFAEPCDPTNPERVAATTAIHEYVKSIVQQTFPTAAPDAMADAVWALVHGLAFLHLDGKFDAISTGAVAERVRAAVHAILGASGSFAAPPAAQP
ncbi:MULTISPECIES: TetR/AcrR family transcriptional regulator [Rhodococcus]|jgi:AcrR family transcriptional regulator|uniref:DNA-binding transcriptional regulator, AcrR family n=2 Tax=Rhodococcus TaxID=1827 RepID=A0A1H4VXG8_9NOCA|nr:MULTISPECIES: TetR/AcrR family transcriptional regulator [Rhodococcus]ABG94899.1 probable transcriptional regulator, TetR family protein [Rhodococcus jostii RHA1]SEC85655.1 DNA-binding transcriptional regulator, AcrR family [Rhodococcus koreensis]